MNKEFIQKLKESNLWDADFKDMDDFMDNGLLKNEIIPELPKLIANIVRTGDMMKVYAERQLSNYDLSIPQKNVLEALYFNKKDYITQGELSKFVYTSKANMSSLLERMEKKGYITREENLQNKREKKVLLTKSGEKKYLELLSQFEKYNLLTFNTVVNEKEAKIVHNVLLRLRDLFKEIDKNEKR